MKLFKYSEYITESKLELLLEANMQFSEDFLAVVARVKSPISEKILKLYKTDVDVDTNYIDVSDKENFVEFKSDRRVETACTIVSPGEIYEVLSKNLFPSFASIYQYNNSDSWKNYIEVNQTARIVKQLTSDDDRLPTSLKDSIERGQSLYHIQWNFSGKNYECIIGGSGIKKGEKSVKPQEVRVGSLIQSLLKKSGEEVDGSELEDFVVKFNSEVKSRKENIFRDFQIVKGEDIKEYYLGTNYESSEHTLGSSCMRHDRCQDYLNIYVKNRNQVSMVVLFSEKNPDKIRGRALLWINPVYEKDVKYGNGTSFIPNVKRTSEILSDYEDNSFMDRIYTNKSKDEELFKKFAIKNGFVYKKNQNYSKQEFMFNDTLTDIESIRVELDNSDYGNGEFGKYPYVDTLTYYSPSSKLLTNINSYGGEYSLEDTDGGNGEECERCDGEGSIECPRCDGDGSTECPDCDGGSIECSNCDGDGSEICSTCNGSGKDGEDDCTDCDGDGKQECESCHGDGSRLCSRCDGNGDISCTRCDGECTIDCPDCQ